MSKKNKEVIREWLERANRQDGDALAELYHDDAVYTSPKGVVEGKKAIHAAFLEIFDRTPDLHTATVTLVGDGEQVALEMIATGKTVKPHPNIPGSKPGLVLENHGVHWFGIRDGKIFKDRAYFDLESMFLPPTT